MTRNSFGGEITQSVVSPDATNRNALVLAPGATVTFYNAENGAVVTDFLVWNPSSAAYDVTATSIVVSAGGSLPRFQGPDGLTELWTLDGGGMWLRLRSYSAGGGVDATAVHQTGNETVAGTKTFSSPPVVPDSSFATSATTGLPAALAAAAPLASPAFTGTPTAPSPTGTTGVANKSYVDSAITSASGWTLRMASTIDKVVTNSTTLSADTDLNVPIGAGQVWFLIYELEFNLATGGGTGTDISAQLTFPSGATGRWSAAFDWDTPQGASAAARGALSTIASGMVFAMDEANGSRGLTIKARVINTAGSAGTVGFTWAQNVASTAALTRLAYSHVSAQRVI